MTLYTVRQYRPAFFSGFEDAVVEHVETKDLMNPDVLPWLKNFQHKDDPSYAFVEFYMESYWLNELTISARYNNGKHWVAAIAVEEAPR